MNLIQKILLESELDNEDEFDINSIFEPNEKAKQELERRKKVFEKRKKVLEFLIKRLELGLQRINKAYKNRQWESEEEKLFLESFYKSEVKLSLEKYPNEIFITKNGKIIASQELKNEEFWIDYDSTWYIFERRFNKDYRKIQSFMKIMLNKYFKLKDYIPISIGGFYETLLNEHFKLKK